MSNTKHVILIIDDDPVCRDITRRILAHELRDMEVELQEGADGSQAIKLAHTHHPALILMDVAMPVLSGPKAVEQLKNDPETASIPVIAVTAMVLPLESDQLTRQGFDGYIPKPIDYDNLVRAVRDILSAS